MGAEWRKGFTLPKGWNDAIDAATGKTYFWNEDTRETSWNRPVVSVAAAAAGLRPPSMDEKKKVGAMAQPKRHPRHNLLVLLVTQCRRCVDQER